MLKRYLAPLIIVGLVFGGGAVAWARSDASRPTVVTDIAAAAGVGADGSSADATAAPPDPAARRAAVQKCLADAGISKGSKPAADQRQKALQCLKDAGFKGGLRRKAAAKAILGRAVHGTFIVKGKGGQFQTVTYDRGTESGVDGAKLSIARPDGPTVTVTLTKDTKFKGVSDASGLQAGRPTVVISDKDGNALLVGQRDKAAAANAN
jgi:hypothetical protein